jgi:hypothetical protein
VPYFEYASFPNSRNRNRPPTTKANTYQVTIGNLDSLVATRVAPANQNRTYIVLKNLNESFDFWYLYVTTLNYSPAVVPTFGVTKQIAYNSLTNIFYQKQDDGINTNWVVTTPQDAGERIEPFQSASLESLEDIYCVANTLTAAIILPLVPVVVDIDEGRG